MHLFTHKYKFIILHLIMYSNDHANYAIRNYNNKNIFYLLFIYIFFFSVN